jgi:uncharacterized protein YuzE
MAQKVATKDLRQLARLCPILKDFPIHRMHVRYDEEADVLYVKFADTQPIYKSDLTKDDILVEYDGDRNIVGVTILDASRR